MKRLLSKNLERRNTNLRKRLRPKEMLETNKSAKKAKEKSINQWFHGLAFFNSIPIQVEIKNGNQIRFYTNFFQGGGKGDLLNRQIFGEEAKAKGTERSLDVASNDCRSHSAHSLHDIHRFSRHLVHQRSILLQNFTFQRFPSRKRPWLQYFFCSNQFFSYLVDFTKQWDSRCDQQSV